MLGLSPSVNASCLQNRGDDFCSVHCLKSNVTVWHRKAFHVDALQGLTTLFQPVPWVVLRFLVVLTGTKVIFKLYG